ncbi:hypothetical protein [Nocardiopsis ganjiahuensis]|uniref:hypothetical protein n=1 Tax=Nocardiopsis ganjiahuensis TaxID=239984 RepID=UPI00047775B9|nr:hypothetical protein [Nocardiopsis ganjiahuensis]
MASSDHSGKRGRAAAAAEDPTAAVPEADAAEQRAPAGADDLDDWTEETPGEAFAEADEADVIEQARDAGLDEEEHR